MRTLMLLGLIVGGLVVAGAIHISRSGDQIDVSIDTKRVEAVTGQALRQGEAMLRNAQNAAPPSR
jgi:hypothetical protein